MKEKIRDKWVDFLLLIMPYMGTRYCSTISNCHFIGDKESIEDNPLFSFPHGDRFGCVVNLNGYTVIKTDGLNRIIPDFEEILSNDTNNTKVK